jgi:hypothetical protein
MSSAGVSSGTPIYVRKVGYDELDILDIETLPEKYAKSNTNAWKQSTTKIGKEYCDLFGVDCWTEFGWTSLRRIERNVIQPSQRMWRVVTSHGIIDVTDGFPLLTIDESFVEPIECLINGHNLLHHNLSSREIEYYSSNITTSNVNHFQNLEFSHDKKLWCQIYYFLLKDEMMTSVRYDIDSKKHVVSIFPNDPPVVNSIIHKEIIQYDGFVYDLITDNYRYAAGIGNLIVHNTEIEQVDFTRDINNIHVGEFTINDYDIEFEMDEDTI